MVGTRLQLLVSRFLAGDLSADDFVRQMPDGWDLDRTADRESRRLALRIFGYLSEVQAGSRDERWLRDQLRGLPEGEPDG